MIVDTDRFRLRRFVEELIQQGECETHDAPLDLIDVAGVLDRNRRAIYFAAVGPERANLVGNVMGSRRRLALALDADEKSLTEKLHGRLAHPLKPQRVSSQDAPVHEVIVQGEAADLCTLPVHLQHADDGAPYISASLDFALFPGTGYTNIGCRRLMLRGPRQAGVDLLAPSDLRAIFLDAVKRGEPLPVSYVVGTHPADFMAAMASTAPMDELEVMGAVRGTPVPIVKCITNDVWVPADAEYVLEGFLDPKGHVEPEGPYGEYVGYYGVLKRNPVFHLTAITRRKDALFQTVTISGKGLARTETAHVTSVKTEAAVWSALRSSVREPIAVYATPTSGGMYNVRASLRQHYPGEPKNAIASVFGCKGDVKHVFVFDEDIDVFSDEEVDWALATRFQSDRDLLLGSGFRVVPLDPSLGGGRTGAKMGFDCTIPFARRGASEFAVPMPPILPTRKRQSVEDALREKPASFLELMASIGTRDGRDVVRELGRLYATSRLGRLEHGRYTLQEEDSDSTLDP